MSHACAGHARLARRNRVITAATGMLGRNAIRKHALPFSRNLTNGAHISTIRYARAIRPVQSFPYSLQLSRQFSTEQKKQDESGKDTTPQPQEQPTTQSTVGSQPEGNTAQTKQNIQSETTQDAQYETKQDNTQQQTNTQQDSQTETKQNTEQQDQQQENKEQREELPPWFASLPIWKKLLYPSLAVSFFSMIVLLIYESNMRSTYIYKRTMQIIRNVDEIKEAFGETIKEPKWYRFWDCIYGYTWETGAIQGTGKLWIPFVGEREIPTGEINQKGEPVVRKELTRGRAYVEASRAGAGVLDWDLVYLVVQGGKLGQLTLKDGELLADMDGRTVKVNKEEMVLINRRLKMGSSEFAE